MSIESVAAQLKEIFGNRLKMVAAFGDTSNSCAIVQSLTIEDLDAGAVRIRLNAQGYSIQPWL